MASHNGDLDKLFKPFMEWLSKGDLGGFFFKKIHTISRKNMFKLKNLNQVKEYIYIKSKKSPQKLTNQNTHKNKIRPPPPPREG